MAIDKQTAKFIARIVENLPPHLSGREMQRWIENPRELQSFLSGFHPLPKKASDFEVLRTIKIGVGPGTADNFSRVFESDEHYITQRGDDILNQSAFKVSDVEVEVDLVAPFVFELGFENGATRDTIYTRALMLGFELCLAEVGPQLCLHDTNHPIGERRVIGMQPILDSDGDFTIFGVGREHENEGRCLYGFDGHPDYVWEPNDRFVFVRPRK